MGTVFSFDIRTPGVAENAVEEAVRWLHRVDSTFSTYRADSQISRLARGELSRDTCTSEVQTVLACCDQLREETGGYFSAYASRQLDPSGYVKGWSIERASDLLVAAGSRNHCVNGGGDVQCVGEAAPAQPWHIGITHPLQPRSLIATVGGGCGIGDGGLAVATSGIAERGPHIIDPHTRYAPDGLVSVTVVGSHLGRADAYATAAFAMGPSAKGWLDRLPRHWSYAVTTGGASWASTGWAQAT